eukprot:GHRQ01033821.1.p1 GENE.GHRQ01033821.1~~GHRQ01033821.1.p1  ORF type:complete len:155 (+),score=17.54 GHRQ01033821.1:203-667(+)
MHVFTMYASFTQRCSRALVQPLSSRALARHLTLAPLRDLHVCLGRAEGTFGVVHRARCKATGAIYALKKLKLEQCPDGFPQTSVREMNVLLSLRHPKIVNVAEVGGCKAAAAGELEVCAHARPCAVRMPSPKAVTQAGQFCARTTGLRSVLCTW